MHTDTETVTQLLTQCVILALPTRKETTTAKVLTLSDEQLVYFWLRFLFLFEPGNGLGAKRVLGSGDTYKFYVQLLSRLVSEFAHVGRIVQRRTQEAVLDTAELERLQTVRVEGRFVQSPTFKSDMHLLYFN
jgi:hypothetical protein